MEQEKKFYTLIVFSDIPNETVISSPIIAMV